MSNMMEIDSPQTAIAATAGTAAAGTTQIKIHPLAIIGISDHQTRVTTGGSPLSSTTSSSSSSSPSSSTPPPMIGLLFGYQNGITISIIDSEEVEYPSSSSSSGKGTVSTITPEQQKIIKTKIELHQKVFPMHEVVGWYRIDISGGNANGNENDNANDDGDDDDDGDALPTEADLMINNGWMKEYNESPLFVLMDANEKRMSSGSLSSEINQNDGDGDEKDPKKKKNDSNSKQQSKTTVTAKTYDSSQGEEARDKLDRDEQLPLSIYETMNTGGGGGSGVTTAFVNLDFELETFEPERIAVEKVFQTKPKSSDSATSGPSTAKPVSNSSSAQANNDSSNSSANPEESNATTATGSTRGPAQAQIQTESAAGEQIQSLITSIEAMNTRIAVLLDFLHKTKSGEIPPNHALLRQVGSLINQLPLVLGKGVFANCSSNTSTSGSTDALFEEGKMENATLANEFENEYDDMLIASLLATIAKTTKSVLSYSARFKVLNESGRREMGKGRYDRSFKDDF